jgi:hypothetical protein
MDMFQLLFLTCGGVMGVVFIVYGVLFADADIDNMPTFLKKKRYWFLMVLLLLIGSLMPSSKDFALIYVLPKVADSQAIKQDLPELYDMAIDKLKDLMKED